MHTHLGLTARRPARGCGPDRDSHTRHANLLQVAKEERNHGQQPPTGEEAVGQEGRTLPLALLDTGAGGTKDTGDMAGQGKADVCVCGGGAMRSGALGSRLRHGSPKQGMGAVLSGCPHPPPPTPRVFNGLWAPLTGNIDLCAPQAELPQSWGGPHPSCCPHTLSHIQTSVSSQQEPNQERMRVCWGPWQGVCFFTSSFLPFQQRQRLRDLFMVGGGKISA